MLQNIIKADIQNKQKHNKSRLRYKNKINNNKTKTTEISTQTTNTITYKSSETMTEKKVMCDKSTSTEDLVKKEKERKKLEKFKKQTLEKQEKAELFKQVLGSPRNTHDIEDE